jgi:hypothetical protein
MRKTIIAISIVSLMIPFVALGQIKAPESTDQAKEMIGNLWDQGKQQMPQNLKNSWNNDVLPVWQQMYGWFKANIWPKAKGALEKQNPNLKQDYETEKGELEQEVKERIPGIKEDFKNIKDKIKDLLK